VATVLLFALLAFSAYGKIPVLRMKPFLIISASSYALYLFRNNLGCLLIKQVNDLGVPPAASLMIGIAFAFVFAIAYTFLLEQPLTKYLQNHWRDLKLRLAQSRWFGSRSKVETTA
jgi:peptidoglycan/LPS O-acetylase OafA/YrhL